MKSKLFNVRSLTLLVVSNLLFSGCIEEKSTPAPQSKIPAEVVGQWLSGQFSMGEFWKHDGTYTGNAFELGIAFHFKKEGQCEFYLVTGGTSYSCRTEAFVYKKGTVAFSNNSFTFYPTEGNTRGFYKGCASSYQNYDQKTPKEKLKPETYYYTLEKDSNGKNQLLIRFKPEDQVASYFRQTQW